MPVDWSKYPDDWPERALAIKQTTDWKCQACGKQCRRPGESFDTHKRTLTVAHVEHGNHDGELLALCAPCHLRMDAKHHARTRRNRGQMVMSVDRQQIADSDGVHCYLDTISCYGTLVELGYANALAKPIRIFVSKTIPKRQKRELWFVLNMPGNIKVEEGNELSFSRDFLAPVKSFKQRYHEYLQSEEWNRKRLTKLQEAGYRCQLCNAKGFLHVHHRTYDRIFNELPDDLIALCNKCHEKFHDIEVA